MKSQCEDLMTYLDAHPKGITQEEALYTLGIGRLSARIYDLRYKYGYEVETLKTPVRTRRGKATVACYRKAQK